MLAGGADGSMLGSNHVVLFRPVMLVTSGAIPISAQGLIQNLECARHMLESFETKRSPVLGFLMWNSHALDPSLLFSSISPPQFSLK